MHPFIKLSGVSFSKKKKTKEKRGEKAK